MAHDERPLKAQPPFTLADLVTLVGGELHRGDPATPVGGIAPLDDAGPADATFFGNPKYLPALRRTAAGTVLVPASHVGELLALHLPGALVAVPNPTHAFSRLIERFAPPAPAYTPGVHPTAVLGAHVTVGDGVHVGPHAVLEDDVTVGARSVIGAGWFPGSGHDRRRGLPAAPARRPARGHPPGPPRRHPARRGDRRGRLRFELVHDRHEKIPQRGYVQVDDDVEIGANTTWTAPASAARTSGGHQGGQPRPARPQRAGRPPLPHRRPGGHQRQHAAGAIRHHRRAGRHRRPRHAGRPRRRRRQVRRVEGHPGRHRAFRHDRRAGEAGPGRLGERPPLAEAPRRVKALEAEVARLRANLA